MNQINSILSQLKPFVAMVALLFGVVAASMAVASAVHVTAPYVHAAIYGALAIIAGRS